MKNKLLIILLLFMTSCDLVFHEEDNKYIVIDKEQEKIDLLNGVYSLLSQVYNQNYFILMSRGDDINEYINYSFDIRNTLPSDFQGGLVACSSSGGSVDFAEYSGTAYKNLYTGIVTINSLLAQLQVEKDSLLMGELYFLRGYSYFQLEHFFGTPPLIFDTEVSYTVPKPTFEQVFQVIEEDLLNALQLLPDHYLKSRIVGETPHQGTVKALLAEVYLAWAGYPLFDSSKYSVAAKYSGEVIQNAGYYNFVLLDDFAALWRQDQRHNKENIFGIYYDEGTPNPMNPTSKGGSYDDYTFLHCRYQTKFKFFNSFPNSYRKACSIVTGIYRSVTYQGVDSTIGSTQFDPVDPLVNPCDYLSAASFIKWIDYRNYEMSIRPYGYNNSNLTTYLLRYAQTLLTYAEASARSGIVDNSVLDAVNRVRRRANNVDLNSPSQYDLATNLTTQQFIDSVVWERAWELCGEPGGRWFDIIRLDMKDQLKDLIYRNDPQLNVPADLISDDWYFFKIPKEDQWLNENFK